MFDRAKAPAVISSSVLSWMYWGKFRILQGNTATGSSGKPRLTNLMELTLDTSWWTRSAMVATSDRAQRNLQDVTDAG